MGLGLKTLAVISATAFIAPAAFAASNGGTGDANGGDATKGAKVFKSCAACHKVGDGAKNAAGPMLNNLIGRTAGSVEGYRYSKSLVAAGEAGLVWDEASIAAFIENPRDFLREYLDDSKAKSKMSKKVKKEADRVNVAAYLATFSEAPEEAAPSE